MDHGGCAGGFWISNDYNLVIHDTLVFFVGVIVDSSGFFATKMGEDNGFK